MKNSLLLIFIIIFLMSCKEKPAQVKEQPTLVTVKTIELRQGDIEETFHFQGSTIFLKKNTLVAPISGFVFKKLVNYGDRVQKNQLLFELQTKESKALENVGTFKENTNRIQVLASASGFVNELAINESGRYVVEGEPLCSIVEDGDLLVQGNMPFEYNGALSVGKKCVLLLADTTRFEGTITKILPQINAENQTQRIFIKPAAEIAERHLPENLNIEIQIVLNIHNAALLLEKEALMCNETQSEFWVMKMLGDTMAIKIPVIKGIEKEGLVEIISDQLKINDRIVNAGAYGMEDSTHVRIEK